MANNNETPMAKLLKQWKIVKELLFEMKEQISQKETRIAELESTLKDIAEWKLPKTGHYWDLEQKDEMSYGACYGSNGERDYMKKKARDILIKK
jgi:hypothetical protein